MGGRRSISGVRDRLRGRQGVCLWLCLSLVALHAPFAATASAVQLEAAAVSAVDLRVATDDLSVMLRWQTTEDVQAQSYRILRRTDTVADYAAIGETTSLGYVDSTVRNSRCYYYRVDALDSSGVVIASSADVVAAMLPARGADATTAMVPIHVTDTTSLGIYPVELRSLQASRLSSLTDTRVLPEEEARLDAPYAAPIVQYPSGPQYNPVTTAQMGLADYTRYRSTGDARFFLHAKAAADWLIERQGADGAWRVGFDFEDMRAGWTSGMYQGQGISLLTRVFAETAESKYVEAARRARDYMMLPLEQGGTLGGFSDGQPILEEYPGSREGRHVLNGSLFAILGVRDLSLATQDPGYDREWRLLAQSMADHLEEYDVDGWSRYALTESGARVPVTAVYHRLHIAQLRVMAHLTGDRRWTTTADAWERRLEDWFNRGYQEWPIQPLRTVAVSAGSAAEVDFAAVGSSVALALSSVSATPTVSITGPAGEIPVTVLPTRGSRSVLVHAPTLAPGTYRASVRLPDGVSGNVRLSVSEMASRIVDFAPPQRVAALGSIVVTASAPGCDAASLSMRARLDDGQPVTMSDRGVDGDAVAGDGIYSAAVRMPKGGSVACLSVDAAGVAPTGTPFQRRVVAQLTVDDPLPSLSGTFGLRLPTDASGKYTCAEVSVGVHANAGVAVSLVADIVEASSGTLIRRVSSVATIGEGEDTTLTIPVPAEHISSRLGASGVLLLDTVRLAMADDEEATIATAVSCARTAVVSPGQFASAPPTTAALGLPTRWQNRDVSISLEATDSPTGCGVAETLQSLGDSSFARYAGPFVVSGEASRLSFYSVDRAGNTEQIQAVTVLIDKTPPEAVCDALPSYLDSAVVKVDWSDTLSGVESTYVSLDGAPFRSGDSAWTHAPGEHTLRYYAVDRAGNRSQTFTRTFSVLARVVVSAPRSRWNGERSYTISGSLRHMQTPETKPVRIYRWRYVNSRWVSYGYVLATARDYDSYARYSVRHRFPAAGTWRIRAYHRDDSAGTSTWSKCSYVKAY